MHETRIHPFFQRTGGKYPDGAKIRVVQDNLNTHSTSYEYLPAEGAFALAQRFEFFQNPKSASWLIEIEFSALARQGLNRRIRNKELLEKEILAFFKE